MTLPSAPPLPVVVEASPEPQLASPGTAESDALDAQIRQNERLAAASRQVLSFGGYIDFGFFVPQGNGAGYVQDYGHQIYSEFANRYVWVFLGDILAPAVNSRGEVADLGDAPGVDRYDSINSRGAPGFVVNEVNLRLEARPASDAIITTSVNLTPRTGSDFSLGRQFRCGYCAVGMAADRISNARQSSWARSTRCWASNIATANRTAASASPLL